MIHQLLQNFKSVDRDIEALSNVLIVFIIALATRVAFLLYQEQYDGLWFLLGSIAPIVAALLIARAAARLIINGQIIREDDRRQELVRVTHHLIAVTKDLKARVGYVKSMLNSDSRSVIVLNHLAITIERRYETLLERDAYQFLPGNCVDIIISISGAIFGIGAMAEGVKHITAQNPFGTLEGTWPNNGGRIIQLDKLMDDLQALIDGIYKMRSSIEPSGAGT